MTNGVFMPTLVVLETMWIDGTNVLRALCDIEFTVLVTDITLEEMKRMCQGRWDPIEVLQMRNKWYCS